MIHIAIILGIMAGLFFLVYSYYFWLIMKGQATDFEITIIKSLAGWMIEKGALTKQLLWVLLFFSFILEMTYIVLALLILSNPVITIFTILFAGFDCFHVSVLTLNFIKFFHGQIAIRYIFNWKIERAGAVLLFTHATLVILALLFIHM